jgi:hypothetical protein
MICRLIIAGLAPGLSWVRTPRTVLETTQLEAADAGIPQLGPHDHAHDRVLAPAVSNYA